MADTSSGFLCSGRTGLSRTGCRLNHAAGLRPPRRDRRHPMASSCAPRSGGPGPGVEGVVDDHALFEHRVVIPEVGGQSERDCVQARRLRGQIMPAVSAPRTMSANVCSADSRNSQRLQEGIEAAELAVMRERLSAGDVVGGRASLGRHIEHAIRRHVDELSFRLDETPDQPRAGDAVDLGVFACDPSWLSRRRPSSEESCLPVPASLARL